MTWWGKWELVSPPLTGSLGWRPGLLPVSSEQRNQVAHAHTGKGGRYIMGICQTPAPKQKQEVGKQRADRKLQFHHLITQHVCNIQVPIFESSWSFRDHKWFPKWAAQGGGCANLFSRAFVFLGWSEHVEPEGGGGDPQVGKKKWNQPGVPDGVSTPALLCTYFVT